MVEQELFFKYNMVPTETRTKDTSLDKDLYEGNITWREPIVRRQILLLLHGSYKCNLNCIYCENQHLRSSYKGAVISEELVREIVEKLGDSINEVTWHGGEPLLLPKSLLSILEEEKNRLGYDFITSLQTNSLLLDEETVAFLDKYDIKFGTSFDGINNSISRGKASTDSILRCIEKYPERIGFIGVTYRDTIDLLIENYEYYKSLGVSGIQSCIVRENVIEESNPYLVNNDIAVKKMLEYIDYWIHDANKPIRDSYVSRMIQRVLGFAHLCEDIYCLGGWMIIDPLGNIGFCGHSMLDDPIVNIKDISSFNDILLHPNYLKSMSKQRKLVSSCSSCKWYRVCYGACMGLNYEYSHDYSQVSPRNCEYTRNLLEGIYNLIKDIDITRRDLYNPIFLDNLRECNYYSLTEIYKLEEEYGGNG